MTIEEREKAFILKVHEKIGLPYQLRKEFTDYWTEPDRAPQPKMRFEKEKTWDLNRRLLRWVATSKADSKKEAGNGLKMAPVQSTIKEIRELDELLFQYRLHPTSIPFKDLGKWFDYMKENKLLKKLYQHEIDNLKSCYPNDNFKCRCACVELTLKWYTDTNFTFSNTMEARLKLTT